MKIPLFLRQNNEGHSPKVHFLLHDIIEFFVQLNCIIFYFYTYVGINS